ncbi:MAG: flavin reductase family protein [Candidatus Margulisbacteria bacterium]|nr:flavin reductase family protein [Candidatus Margulisiibacteriota bacterium]
MVFQSNETSSKLMYALMSQTIIPRPIAWVLSDNGDTSYNIAPFSYFNAVSTSPPVLYISAGKKQDSFKKDTLKNIEARSHFVVHIPSVADLSLVTETSAALPFGESEAAKFGVVLNEELDWPLPRIANVTVAFLCKRFDIVEIGTQAMILGEIVSSYVSDTIATLSEGKLSVDPKGLDPLARLGNSYASLGELLNG